MARIPTTTPDPAAPSREDEVLIREIDEAVREDAVMAFMRNHGFKVLGAVSLGVAALAGWLVWDYYAEKNLEQQSESLVTALDSASQNDFRSASTGAEGLLADGNSAGARAAARFLQAGAAIETGDSAKATALYKAIAADTATPPALRDLARIREVALNYDTMPPADVIAQLSPLAQAGSPWFGPAGELVAMAQIEAGNRPAAGKLFAEIAKDDNQPEGLRSRARQMAGLLGVDAVVDVKQLLKDQGVEVAEGDGGGSAAE